MESWRVTDEWSTELPEFSKVVVRIIAGDVTVASGTTPRIDIKRESGSDVFVELGDDGTLFVSQPEPDKALIERLIKAIVGGGRHRCSVAITAPAHCNVTVSTVSAGVATSGFDGGTHVTTVSGEATLLALRNEVDVKTVSGDIDAKDITGQLKLKTVSGDVAVVEGVCRQVDAKTVSGDVLLDLDLDPTGTYDITTVSGDVAVRTVAEPDVAVEATTVSGRLTTDFGLGWDVAPGRKRVDETIGSGGARLWVKTVSGDLRVLRGREAAA